MNIRLTNRGLIILFSILPAALPLRSEEPAARIAQVEGYVIIQRDAELIRLKKDQAANILPGDTVRTRDGAVGIEYENGSALRIDKNTIVLFLPKSKLSAASGELDGEDIDKPQEPGSNKPKPNDLRIRLVMGRIAASIRRGPWDTTVFLLPQSRVALLEGSLQVMANPAGDWQVGLENGEAVVSELAMGLVWRMVSGQRSWVEYLPGGLRISNPPKSSRATTIEFHADGPHEIVAERGNMELSLPDGKVVNVKEKQRIREKMVAEKSSVTGLDPSEAVVILRGDRSEAKGAAPPTGPAAEPETQRKTPRNN
ncbi:MAG: hypothetical protein AB1696_16785 [Planctomycetota bacterium]